MTKKTLAVLLLCSTALLSACGASGPDPRDTDSPFGVLDFFAWNHDWNKHHYGEAELEKAAQMIQDAGIGFVRMDFLWADIEPEQGKFDFAKYDKIVEILAKHDLKILGLLNYNTKWSAKEWNAAPDPALFSNYATEVVKRYKKRVKYWEIWNEPDDRLYWQPQDYMKAYTELLKTVTPAIKKADKTSRVVLGGTAKYIPHALLHIYRNGGKDYFDVVNAHPFQDPRLPEAMSQLKGAHFAMRKVMERYGDGDKEIWFTELGAPGVQTPAKENGWWLGLSPSEDLQARYLTKIYTATLKMKGVKRVFWAFFRDLNGFFEDGVNNFGLVRNDMTPKPSYEAYKKYIQEYNAAHAPKS